METATVPYHYFSFYHQGLLCWTPITPNTPPAQKPGKDYWEIHTHYGQKKAILHGPFTFIDDALQHRADLVNSLHSTEND
jgi:hypothetical protein